MYVPVTTEDFDTWIKAESRTFETRCDVIIGNTTYRLSGSGLSGDIISMQWNNVVCSNDGLQIGTSCMDEFRMEYRNNGIPSLMNSEIHPYVGLVIPHENTGDVTVWIPLGVFYVTNTESNDEDRTFSVTAYDGMQRLMGNINWTALQVEFPINAWTLLQTIANYFGLTLTYDEAVYELLSSDEYNLVTSDGYTLVVNAEINANKNVSFTEGYEGTYRDYIGWIAGLVGANAHMGRSGDLVISRYTDHGMTIPRTLQHMGGTKINFGGSVTYTNIVSGTDENPVYATNYTGNAITYTNPYITVAELDRVCDELIGESGMTITPCDIQWRGDPRLDCGDIVQAEDKDGNYFPVYVMERVMNITGGLSETLHCYVETEVQKVLNKSPLATKLNQVAKSATDYASLINNSNGVMTFIDANEDGINEGFIIHDADGNGLLKCTSGGLGFSNDNGLTYTNAITKEGVLASELHIVRNGVEVMSADESSDGLPELVMRDNDGDNIFLMSPYLANSSLADSDTGVMLNVYNATGRRIAYIGTVGDAPTGKITGSAIYLGNGSTSDTASVTTTGAAILVNGVTSQLRLNHANRNAVLNVMAYNSDADGTPMSVLSLYNPTTGHPVFQVWNSGTSGSVTVRNPVTGVAGVSLSSWTPTDATTSYTRGNISIPDPTDNSLPAVSISNIGNEGKQGLIGIKDGNGNYHGLTVQPITINGTTYYIPCSTS